MDPDEQRAALAALMVERGASLSELSRVLARNPAYLQQYLRRGTPRTLAEHDRGRLARYLGVPETRLGARAAEGLVEIARLDLGASAGPGRLAEEETRRPPAALSPALLRELGVRAEATSMIRVDGDSMEPTLSDGDEILVDRDRRDVRGRGGIFVIRLDGVLMVKRLRPVVGGVEVVSDNPAYPARPYGRDAVDVIGRVVWFSRALV